MKLVINTQYRENYGSAQTPHWKFKGGETYVVENLTQVQVEDAVKSGCPDLSKLLTRMNSMSEEYVIDIGAVENDKVVCDPWEAPIKLVYAGQWKAVQVIENDEYSCMNKAIKRKTITWVLGDDNSYEVKYEMQDGRILSYAEIIEVLG